MCSVHKFAIIDISPRGKCGSLETSGQIKNSMDQGMTLQCVQVLNVASVHAHLVHLVCVFTRALLEMKLLQAEYMC